jgi:epoxyqueuosine reductase
MIDQQPTPIYASAYKTANRFLNDLALKLSRKMQRDGYLTLPIPASQVVDKENWYAAISHKAVARVAGLGWQGKHTNLLSRELGNWFFLGSIFTTLDFEPDKAEGEKCGSCTACLDICPTNAFPAPFQLDARRCISYLTIEHKGPVPEELRALMGNRIYGCDDCLAVCPWNKFAVEAREIRYAARPELVAPPLRDLAALDDGAFRVMFSGSPVKRIGRNRFVRNVLYAIGNSGDAALKDAAAASTDDPAAEVADAAVWAVAQLGGME